MCVLNSASRMFRLLRGSYCKRASLVKSISGVSQHSSTMVVVVDLRSDTVTKPTLAMRKAMAEAEVGDDVFGEDPTVIELQNKAAELLGKEAALFVPSGTMGNLISALIHCREQGSEIILGDKSHIHLYEQGGIARLGGIHHRTISNRPDGTWDLGEMVKMIRVDDPHCPVTKLVCAENTQNVCGGKSLPLEWIDQMTSICKQHNLLVHMDGARLFSSATHLKVSASRIVRDFDSVNICLSKNLASPVGSIIAGSKDFIVRAVRTRKLLGGGMRQSGVLAAAGLVSLSLVDRLEEDHKHARIIAEGIAQMNCSAVHVDLEGLHSNILNIKLDPSSLTPQQFCDRVEQVKDYEKNEIGRKISIRMFPMTNTEARLVTHIDISSDLVNAAVKKFQLVIKELQASK